MKLRHLRGLAAVTLAASLALTACSSDKDAETTQSASPSDSENASAAVETTKDDAAILSGLSLKWDEGKAPADAKFPENLADLSNFAAVVIEEGSGAEFQDGDVLSVEVASFDAEQKVAQSTYEQGAPTTLVFSDSSQIVPQLITALKGQKVGARLAFATPPTPAQEATDQAPATEAADPSVMVLEVVKAVRPWAEGAERKVDDASLPKVTLDENHKPSIEVPKGFKAGDDTKVVVLKQGDGVEVKETDTLHAQYLGVKTNGDQFDASWDRGAPSSFSLQQVIQGWTKGLAGQKIGSQVMLIIPAEQAYGEKSDENTSDLAGEDLIFVVDLLAVN